MSDETVVALFGLSRIQSSENSASWIDLCSAQTIMCSSFLLQENHKNIILQYEANQLKFGRFVEDSLAVAVEHHDVTDHRSH